MNYRFGFIGAGHMGGALAGAACRTVGPRAVLLSDRDAERADALAASLGCAAAPVEEVCGSCDAIFIGVKPQNIAELFARISPMLAARKDRFVLVTMAAGVQMETLRALAGRDYPIIRIMPNTPVAVGAGCILYAAGDGVTEAEKAAFLRDMAGAGGFIETPEALIDAGCAVSGCGPAFVYRFISAMAEAGKRQGLPEETALQLAERTVFGAAKLALDSGEAPQKLCRDVCSPGGSTIEGVRALDSSSFASDVDGAVAASLRRTRELAKT